MKLIRRRDRERLIKKGKVRHSFTTRNDSLFYGSVLPIVPATAPVLFPIVLLRSPDESALWLLSDIHALNHDRAFGLRHAAGGIPEIGYFSIAELEGLRGAHGGRVRQVRGFRPNKTLTAYAAELWANGRINPLNSRATEAHTPQASSRG